MPLRTSKQPTTQYSFNCEKKLYIFKLVRQRVSQMGSHGHEVTRYACMHCHAVYCTCKRYTEVGCVQSVMKASFINYLKCMVNFSVTYHDCMNLSLRVSLDKRDKIKICN